MKILKTPNRKLIIVDILKLIVVLLVPLGLSIIVDSGVIVYLVNSQIYLFWSEISRFRWITTQFPMALALGFLALIFSINLRQRQRKSYPIKSAFLVGLVLSIVPAYYFIQLVIANSYLWLDIIMTAPVSIGYCSILILIFVILPSISWYSDSMPENTSTPEREKNQQPEGGKKTILSPKTSSYFMFLAAFFLPGILLYAGSITVDSSTSIDFVGFLLQFGLYFYTELTQQGLSFYLQDSNVLNIYGVPIICCTLSIIFAWTIMRYVFGRGTKRTAILVGCISLLPPIAYMIFRPAYYQDRLILPIPIVLILGLLVLQFGKAIKPSKGSTELDQSEIKVPLMLRMKSYLSRQDKKSDETPIEHSKIVDEEGQ